VDDLLVERILLLCVNVPAAAIENALFFQSVDVFVVQAVRCFDFLSVTQIEDINTQ
jgi:hypothetical protein